MPSLPVPCPAKVSMLKRAPLWSRAVDSPGPQKAPSQTDERVKHDKGRGFSQRCLSITERTLDTHLPIDSLLFPSQPVRLASK